MVMAECGMMLMLAVVTGVVVFIVVRLLDLL